jgi:hypothetical protein
MMAQTRLEVYLYSFFNLGTRRGWMINATPRRVRLTPENNSVLIV